MNTSVKDLRVLITAGAQGIGLTIAETFVNAGAQVHICDINADALTVTQARLPTITQSHTDVAEAAEVNAMFDQIGARWGGQLDVLVNNAGIAGPTAALADTLLDDWQQTLAVNLICAPGARCHC